MALVPLADTDDVAARLGRSLTGTEESWADPGLLEEATVKVLSHLGLEDAYFDDEDNQPIPAAIVIVTSRMVARVLQQAADGAPAVGTTQTQQTAGPFSSGASFAHGATSGGPWLTRSDKADLDSAMGNTKAFAVDTAPETIIHADNCSLVFGSTYCSCGADIAGSPIYGV